MPDPPANRVQMALLVKFMERNSDIAKGIVTKTYSKQRWEAIADELNCKGTPTKSWEKWSRVWINFKAKTKAKLSENRREFRATGGGRNALHVLSPLENAVENIIVLNRSFDPPGREFGGCAATANMPESLSAELDSSENVIEVGEGDFKPILVNSDAMEIDTQPSTSTNKSAYSLNYINVQTRKSTIKSASKKSKRVALLELQVENQQNFHREMLTRFASIENSLKDLVDLKREKLEILKRRC